jgi:hypothetical protein
VSQAAFQSLFQRSNSTSAGMNNVPSSTPGMTLDQRRRLSVTTLGLSGATPSGAFGGLRRGSVSTTSNSDSIDENAVEDDEYSRTAPTTPFTRRMSFGANAMLSMRAPSGSSPGSTGRPDLARRPSGGNANMPAPATSATFTGRRASSYHQASTAQPARSTSDKLSAARADQGFNWSEQLRSRAENSVSGMSRPSFSTVSGGSPPRTESMHHDRARSVSDMPAPPQQASAMKPKQPERPKPDHFQERILKGDFYMD